MPGLPTKLAPDTTDYFVLSKNVGIETFIQPSHLEIDRNNALL